MSSGTTSGMAVCRVWVWCDKMLTDSMSRRISFSLRLIFRRILSSPMTTISNGCNQAETIVRVRLRTAPNGLVEATSRNREAQQKDGKRRRSTLENSAPHKAAGSRSGIWQ